jgi:hypothetical protein
MEINGVEIRSVTYFDLNHDVRMLVSVYKDNKPIQTIGSWLVNDPVLATVLMTAARTANAFKAEVL